MVACRKKGRGRERGAKAIPQSTNSPPFSPTPLDMMDANCRYYEHIHAKMI